MVQRIIHTWMVVNVRTGECRCVKKLRATLKPSELAIEVKLDVEVPEQPILKAEGKITLSKQQVSNMIIESMTDETKENP